MRNALRGSDVCTQADRRISVDVPATHGELPVFVTLHENVCDAPGVSTTVWVSKLIDMAIPGSKAAADAGACSAIGGIRDGTCSTTSAIAIVMLAETLVPRPIPTVPPQARGRNIAPRG